MRTIRDCLAPIAAITLLLAPGALAQSEGARTLALLTRPLTVEAPDVRFEDFVEFVRTATGATVDIAWINDRHSDGLDPEAIVSVSGKGAPALALLLDAAQQAALDGSQAPTWQLDQDSGALQVGPRSRLNQFKRLEIYDVQDLLFVLPDYKDVPQLNLNSVIRQGQGGGGGGIFQQNQGQTQVFSAEEEAERLMEILRAVIEPDQWIDNGGDGALVRFYEGNLLVSAPDYIHRQINGYAFLRGPVGRPPLPTADAGAGEPTTEPPRAAQDATPEP
ncbi:MAG: hypothetical protein H6814_09275 [Phycisphaeraceae bacterium]|nr:hypothetical protein [Phycisphaeraceae bacterium]